MWNQWKFRYSLKILLMLLLMSLFGVAAATSLVAAETVVDATDTMVVINAADAAATANRAGHQRIVFFTQLLKKPIAIARRNSWVHRCECQSFFLNLFFVESHFRFSFVFSWWH